MLHSISTAQTGSTLVIVLLVLVAVTILGVVGINTGTVELQISRSEREIRETFYLAEAAAAEGVQRLIQTERINLEEQFPFWQHDRKTLERSKIDFRDAGQWDVDGQGQDNALPSPLGPYAFMCAVEWDVAAGSSLICTEQRLYVHRVYGLCRKYNVDDIVEIGFKLRH